MKCSIEGCESLPERNGICSSHNRAARKAESDALKPRKVYTIPKVGEKRKKELPEYSKKKKKFLEGRWCAVHGRTCIPTEIHHVRGKIGYIDDIAREKGITAFMDVRYWLGVCRVAHDEIEASPAKAYENGFSESRLSKK